MPPRSAKAFLALSLGLWLVPVWSAGQATPTTRVEFELMPKAVLELPAAGSLVLRPLSGQPGDEPVVLPLRGGSTLAVDLPSRTRWEVSVEVPGRWARREVVAPGDPRTSLLQRLPLWPVAKVTGSVRVVPGERLPTEIALDFRSPASTPQREKVLESRAACPVDAQGLWTCELPAALLDLTLRAAGFVPHYRWATVLRPGQPVSLGAIELRKGASVSGWVAAEEGAIDPGKCKARLMPLVPPGGALAIAEQLRRTTVEEPVGDRGFFQLSGVAPGSYVLEVEQPGYAPARAFPLEIWGDAETHLKQPVVLRRPIRLELAITPAADWLGQPWKVRVQRASEFSAGYERAPAFEGWADERGRVLVPNQAPGRFWVLVSDAAGNQLFSDPDRVVRGPEDAQQDIEIRLVSVEGKVLLGREPLAATLWFGGRNGALRMALHADEDGEFEGVLPKEGAWLVDVQAEDPKLETQAKVEVRAPKRGRASVTIRVPDTHLFGKVLGEDDRPVAGAEVELSTEHKGFSTESDGNGHFEIRGAPVVPLYLAARSSTPQGRWTSDPVLVPVQEGQPVGPVELRLRKTRPFRGRVESVRGPVAGARVLVIPRRPNLYFADSTRTGLDGTFSVNVPGRTETVQAIVSPPGHALKAFELAAGEETAVLNVPLEGGALEAELPFSPEEAFEKGLEAWIFQDGVAMGTGILVQWAQGHGVSFRRSATSFQVPQLAPSEYKVCLAPRAMLPEGETAPWLEKQGTCASGYLAAGTTLRLEVPGKDQGSKGDDPRDQS